MRRISGLFKSQYLEILNQHSPHSEIYIYTHTHLGVLMNDSDIFIEIKKRCRGLMGSPYSTSIPTGTQSSLLMLASLSPPSSLSTGIFSHFFQLLPIPLWHPADCKSALFQEPHSNGTCEELSRALVPSSHSPHLTSIGYS